MMRKGQTGFLKGCSDPGISTSKRTFFAPPNGKLTEQDSELETLRSQGITGYSISAIDPASAAGTIATDTKSGISVLAIDSPLPDTDAASLYLGTPNYAAGFQAGSATKQVLVGDLDQAWRSRRKESIVITQDWAWPARPYPA
jgi:ribose transport system substrate-binding protein